MIQKHWKFGGLVVTSYLGPNIYSISIDFVECYSKDAQGLPWNFMGKFFNVKDQDPWCSLQEVDMSMATFQAQVHNLLLNYMTLDNAPIIGKQVGKVLKFKEFVYKGVLH